MKTLHDKLLDHVRARGDWETKQRGWYAMAMTGLRRRKVADWQSDMFWPLIAECIAKLTPFYYNQIFSQDRLANFAALKEQVQGQTDAAADWFDYQLKQETCLDDSGEFELTLLLVIWLMLLYGRGVLKVRWDPMTGRLRHEAVHPLALIVPRCEKLHEADEFAEVKLISVGQYSRDRRYVQDRAILEQIVGGAKPAAGTETDSGAEQDRETREGVTNNKDPGKILIWEAYSRTPGGWTVNTYSPSLPSQPLRRPFGLTERWHGKPFLPYIPFTMEVIEGGWYAPRGVAERLAQFQAYLCKCWNEKNDSMIFWNRPLFTSDAQIPNTANMTWTPGELIPGGISAVQMPGPPISFDQELAMTRQLAAEVITMPDAGVSDMVPASQGRGGKMTATEVDYRRALAATGVDLRGRLFRLGLGQAYRKDWALLLAHRPEDLAYFSAQRRRVLPQEALHESYQIEPAGSPDYWHKSLRMQRAAERLQMLNGSPFVRGDELVKDYLAADSSDLVRRVFVAPQERSAEEAEDEAIRIEALLMNGYAAKVKPFEDHETRIKVLFLKLQALAQLGAPVNPLARQRIMEAIAQHLQAIRQANPELAKQIEAAAGEVENPTQPGPMLGAPEQEPAPNSNLQPQPVTA